MTNTSIVVGNYNVVDSLKDAVFTQFKSMYQYDKDSGEFGSESVFAQEVYEDIITFLNGAEQLIPNFLGDGSSYIEFSKDYCLNTDFGNCLLIFTYVDSMVAEFSWSVEFNIGNRTCVVLEHEDRFNEELYAYMREEFYSTLKDITVFDLSHGE